MKTRKDIEQLSSGRLVPYYLLSSYLYYHCHQSPLTDDAFDFLCVRLDREWIRIRHPHRSFVERESVKVGSCFLRADQFPPIVLNAAFSFMKDCVHARPIAVRLPSRTAVPKPVVPASGRRLTR